MSRRTTLVVACTMLGIAALPPLGAGAAPLSRSTAVQDSASVTTQAGGFVQPLKTAKFLRRATSTPTATATNTPLPTATNTPLPTATNTPLPTSTNTPLPTPTSTVLPTSTNTPLPTATSTAVPVSSNGVYLGVWQPGVPTNLSALDTFDQAAGKNPSIVMFWRDWASDSGSIDPTWLSNIAARGSTPMITWSPANWSGDSSSYTLANITNGMFDSYIRSTADTLRNYHGTVLLRTMHEFNGNWYTHWSGNPSGYVAAWRHIHDIFVAEGATNVEWVWCPNTFWTGSLATDPSAYYPGSTYVDWVGLDGYNRSDWGYMSFSKIFSYAVNQLASYGKPIMIAETASGEFSDGGVKKSQWISDAFQTGIPSLPAIKAVLWFNEDKTASESCPCSWPVNTTSAAQAAFTGAVASSYYLSQFHG